MSKNPLFAVKIAREAGYCYGVKRALDMAASAADEGHEPIHTLGPIIHNPQVVESLKGKGIDVAGSLDDVDAGTIIIRSHGVPPDVAETARTRGLHIVDATCPFVTKAQKRADELAAEDYFVVILGEKDHPEVLGILGHAGKKAAVVERKADLKAIPKKEKRIGLVTQTTQSAERLREIAGALAATATELKIFNTICSATARRQAAALTLSDDVDVMVIVGGKNSANTSRLTDLCRATCARTYHIETDCELDPAWFDSAANVGVATGASTSPDILRQVVDRLLEIAAPEDGEG